MKQDAFLIGWSGRLPEPLRRFILRLCLILLALYLGLAVALGIASDDPAGVDFARVPGQAALADLPEDAALAGTVTLAPYPVLHVPPAPGWPRGRAILLAGDGKIGAPGDFAALEGRLVSAQGGLLRRGDIAKLALGTPPAPAEGEAALPLVHPLGRWRITGEICDGKCAAGVMRPGIGLSDRACATLWLQGDIPAVFVSTTPVAGGALPASGRCRGECRLRHLPRPDRPANHAGGCGGAKRRHAGVPRRPRRGAHTVIRRVLATTMMLAACWPCWWLAGWIAETAGLARFDLPVRIGLLILALSILGEAAERRLQPHPLK